MSRGPGQLQRALLAFFETSPAPTTFETLRWNLWEDDCETDPRRPASMGTGRHGQRLPTEWNTSLRRAVLSLASGKPTRILIEDRRLVSLDEMVEHFPNKTLMYSVRSLRLSLLRLLVDWTQHDGPAPRYSLANNEKFYLENLGPSALGHLRTQWNSLEPTLICLLPSINVPERISLFALIAKGYSLLVTRDVAAPRSFGQLAGECLDAGIFQSPLREQVIAFKQALLPADDAGFLRLKSFVHSVVDVPRHRRCHLKGDAIDHLNQICPEVVQALPGYKLPSQRIRNGRPYLLRYDKPKHSPQLHALIDQTVFWKFRFIQPAL